MVKIYFTVSNCLYDAIMYTLSCCEVEFSPLNDLKWRGSYSLIRTSEMDLIRYASMQKRQSLSKLHVVINFVLLKEWNYVRIIWDWCKSPIVGIVFFSTVKVDSVT